MNRQIEELSTKFYFADNMTNDDRWSCNELAEFVISNGYRKSTDVARDIFAEIEKLKHTKWDWNDYVDWDAIAELKKKYENEGADDE